MYSPPSLSAPFSCCDMSARSAMTLQALRPPTLFLFRVFQCPPPFLPFSERCFRLLGSPIFFSRAFFARSLFSGSLTNVFPPPFRGLFPAKTARNDCSSSSRLFFPQSLSWASNTSGRGSSLSVLREDFQLLSLYLFFLRCVVFPRDFFLGYRLPLPILSYQDTIP